MGRYIAIETARGRRALRDASVLPKGERTHGFHQSISGQALRLCMRGNLAVIKRMALERNQESARRRTQRDRTTKPPCRAGRKAWSR